MNMVARKGGALAVDQLRSQGISRVFCVPGESYLAVLDALYGACDEIDVVTCRHEQGAATMAEAVGKLTGEPGVCLVTRGPGACNAAIAIHTAQQDSTPMVLLVGQVPRSFLGREAFQEVDFVRFFGGLAKDVVQIEQTADIPSTLARAFETAMTGRRGPVVVVLPEDILTEVVEVSTVPSQHPADIAPDPGLLQRLHHILGDAERPMMLLGGSGWTAQARADIQAFTTVNELPVCVSFRRNDLIDNDSSVYAGELGFGVNPALIERVHAADVLLVVGSRLGDATSQGYTLIKEGTPELIHVHPDPQELGRIFPTALSIPASVAGFARVVRRMPVVGGEHWRPWAEAARADYEADSKPRAADFSVDPGTVMADLRDLLPERFVVTVDAGNFSGWPQRFLRYGRERRLLGPCNGAMGYAVPAAIAAQLTEPDRTVVACVGDGGFGMTGQELATAARYGARPIVLVFNNGIYGTIRMHQERTYPGHPIATALTNPDFAALARAYGLHGETVQRTDEFRDAFRRAMAADCATVIDLHLDPEQISTRSTLSGLRRTVTAPTGVDDANIG